MKNIIKPTIIICLGISTVLFTGCGSAEAIKGYRYETTKAKLEKAVMKVIKSNPHIYLDPIEKSNSTAKSKRQQ